MHIVARPRSHDSHGDGGRATTGSSVTAASRLLWIVKNERKFDGTKTPRPTRVMTSSTTDDRPSRATSTRATRSTVAVGISASGPRRPTA